MINTVFSQIKNMALLLFSFCFFNTLSADDKFYTRESGKKIIITTEKNLFRFIRDEWIIDDQGAITLIPKGSILAIAVPAKYDKPHFSKNPFSRAAYKTAMLPLENQRWPGWIKQPESNTDGQYDVDSVIDNNEERFLFLEPNKMSELYTYKRKKALEQILCILTPSNIQFVKKETRGNISYGISTIDHSRTAFNTLLTRTVHLFEASFNINEKETCQYQLIFIMPVYNENGKNSFSNLSRSFSLLNIPEYMSITCILIGKIPKKTAHESAERFDWEITTE
ncbi:hypothetical protein [Candidatus Sororendozoicomonas aggregata]|uniref:hypothetical protein n=1 Tax=Candidatus Sororendozoicomonas aggregata TaxID=3073239 RepID=UPI002ED5B7BB